MHTNKDLYELLGLTKEASEDDIQRAHRKLVREYHPDTNPKDPQAEERFRAVQYAYEVLSDDKKRREYDRTLHASFREDPSRPHPGETRAQTGGGVAQGAAERAHRDRGPMFRLGYLLGIVLVAVVIALLIWLVLGLQ